MRQVSALIPTYSSDEFGICSALYELGGMVVMHDASGCNSTYTTHDEPRWYDMESRIYISAISEMEAIMGDDQKLIDDIIETARAQKPRFVAVVGAPIPYMIGTDLKAIARILEEELNIPCFGFPANGMQDYLCGINMALEAIADHYCIEGKDPKEKSTAIRKVNILGATPLDFSLNGSISDIKKWLEDHGLEVLSAFAMGSSLEDISRAGQADVNLLISSGALAAAELLKDRFSTPWVSGVPVGIKYPRRLLEKIKDPAAPSRQAQEDPSEKRTVSQSVSSAGPSENGRWVILGEAVSALSIQEELLLSYGIQAQVLLPLETPGRLLQKGAEVILDESRIIEKLAGADHVIADPFYRPLCGKNVHFHPWPHEAFSGRIYDSVNPNLITKELKGRIL